MTKNEIMPYLSAEMDLDSGEGVITESQDGHKSNRITIPGAVSINGFIIQNTDLEFFLALRHKLQDANEEEREKIFHEARMRVEKWLEATRTATGSDVINQDIVEKEMADRMYNVRGLIEMTCFYLDGAIDYFERFTDFKEGNEDPMYTESNMRTMFNTAKYLETYISKADLSEIDSIRVQLLRKLKTNPQEALHLSDGKVRNIPDINEKEMAGMINNGDGSEVVKKAKEMLERWNNGVETITKSDVYILKAYLLYFEEYAEKQIREISAFREFIIKGKSNEGKAKAEMMLDRFFEGEYHNDHEFAYDIFSIEKGNMNLQELRDVVSAFNIKQRKAQNGEVFRDLETALKIARKRMSINHKNTDPVFNNVPPNVTEGLLERAINTMRAIKIS